MGIIGANIEKELSNQIKVRQEKLGMPIPDTDSIVYNNSKTSWLRVASSVDITDPTALGISDLVTSKNNALAKNLVLAGPAINSTGNIPNTIFPDSSGLSAEAKSLLGVGGNTSKWGLTPPPGVESVSIQALNRGAINKGQIKIKAHNPDQFRLLEVLYLRLGFTILVEWGHSIYYDNEGNLQQFSGFATEPFTNFMNGKSNFTAINKSIQSEIERRNYNYDGFLGYISNFNWTFNPDATYDITLDVISRGGLIDSLTTNKTGTNNSVGGGQDGNKATDTNATIIGMYLKHWYKTFKNATSGQNDAIVEYEGKDSRGRKTKISVNSPDYDAGQLLRFDVEKEGEIERFNMKENSYKTKSKSSSEDNDFYYISMGMFLRLLSTRCLVYEDDRETGILSINTDYETHWMLSHPYQQSVDPRICRLKNATPKGSWKPFGDLGPLPAGFTGFPPMEFENGGVATPKSVSPNLFKPSSSNPFAGDIMGIMLNMTFVVNAINKNIDEEGNVGLTKLLKFVLDNVAKVTGGINKFNVSYSKEKNEVIIYDDNTIPQKGATKETRTPIHIYDIAAKNSSKDTTAGLGSFVTNLNFSSKIFPKIQNSVAIAAQNPNEPVGEQVGSFQKLNRGIVDRTSKGAKGYYAHSAKQLTTYEKFYTEIYFLNDYFETIYNNRQFTYPEDKIESNQSVLKDILALDFSWRSGENQIASPFFIPVELSLELDGIAGFKLYEKFDITPEYILPPSYLDNLNFVIQGVSNELNNGKWTTKLQTLSWTAEEAAPFTFDGGVLYGEKKTGVKKPETGEPTPDGVETIFDGFTDPTLEPKLITISDSIAENFGVPLYTTISSDKAVQWVHPKSRTILKRFLDNMLKDPRLKGATIGISSSLRSFKQQNDLHKAKPSNAKPGGSKHNYGCAFDINILDQKTGQVVAGKTKVGDNDNIRATWVKLGIPEIATTSGVTTWGANFDNYFDPVHFGIDVNIPASLKLAQEYALAEGKDWKTLEADDIFKIDIVTT